MTTPMPTLAALSLLALACLAAPAAAQQGPPFGGTPPSVSWDESPEALVISFEHDFGQIAGDHRVRLEIWGDGRTVVTRPWFSPRSERVEGRLTRAELRALLLDLGGTGAFAFDEPSARAELRSARRAAAEEARAGRGLVMHRSDPVLTVVELNVRRYESGRPGEAPLTNVQKRVRWKGLDADADFHGNVEPIAGLDAAQDRLRRVIDSPAFR